MKKALSLVLSIALLLSLCLVAVQAAPAAGLITEQGADPDPDGGRQLIHVDASVTNPDDYKKIVGFKFSADVTQNGGLGEYDSGTGDFDFNMNSFIVSRGARAYDEFGWDLSGSFPTYIGPASEMATYVQDGASGTFLGGMFYGNAINVDFDDIEYAGQKNAEDTNWIGLFKEGESVLSICAQFGTEIEITEFEWIFTDMDKDPDEPEDDDALHVEYDEYWDIPTIAFEDLDEDGIPDDENFHNYVDIKVPSFREGPFPVVLWIHGGAWSSLDRKSVIINKTMTQLLSKGFAVVSVEYQLTEVLPVVNMAYKTGYPRMIYDLKAAVRFLRANAEKYNLDPSFIASMGESAGAHLALLMGATNGELEYEGLDVIPDNYSYSSDVQTMVSYFGPTTLVAGDGPACAGANWSAIGVEGGFMLDMIMGMFGMDPSEAVLSGSTDKIDASPYRQLTTDDNLIPLFVTHGINDGAVTIEQSYVFVTKYAELAGLPAPTFEDYVDSEGAEKSIMKDYDLPNFTTQFLKNGPHGNKAAFDGVTARNAITNFLVNLSPLAADKTALKAGYDPAKAIDLSKYVSEGADRLSTALNVAKSLLDDAALKVKDQDAVDKALSDINFALERLVLRGDKTELAKLIEDSKKKVRTDETDEVWEAFTEALAWAESVFADEDAIESDVEDAFTSLQAAYSALSANTNVTTPEDPEDPETPEDEDKTSPKTGDTSSAIPVAIMMVSMGALAIVVRKRKVRS